MIVLAHAHNKWVITSRSWAVRIIRPSGCRLYYPYSPRAWVMTHTFKYTYLWGKDFVQHSWHSVSKIIIGKALDTYVIWFLATSRIGMVKEALYTSNSGLHSCMILSFCNVKTSLRHCMRNCGSPVHWRWRQLDMRMSLLSPTCKYLILLLAFFCLLLFFHLLWCFYLLGHLPLPPLLHCTPLVSLFKVTING